MKSFSISLMRRDFVTPVPLGNMSFTVNNYSHSAQGGPKQASITVFASESDLWSFLDMLRYGIEINNHRGEKVWWGYISNVELRTGWFTLGVDLENFTNNIRVAFTNLNIRYTTDYQTDVLSESTYGTKQMQLSLSDATLQQANQYRDTELTARKYPIPTLRIESQGEGGYSVTLTCKGWYDTLDWKLYQQPKGLEVYDESGGGSQKLGVNYAASTISFVSASEINDTSGSGLSRFDAGDIISITGTSNNNGNWLIQERSSAGTGIEVDISTASLVTEASGTTFTIKTASSINQSFSQRSGSTWNAHSIHLRIKSIASPTDAIWAQIRESNSGSVGTLKASGSIIAASITESMSWIQIQLSSSAALINGSSYFISIYRDGPISSSAHYLLDVNEETGYQYGGLVLHSGSNYHARDTDADMPFKVVGTQETTEQIREMVQDAGQFFNAIDIAVSSSIMTNQYREGETTALTEIKNLMNTGALNGRKLLSVVTPERRLKIYSEPSITASSYKLKPNRKIYAYSDTEIELSICPVGIWISLDNVVPTSVDVSRIANFTNLFIEEAEYFAESDAYVPHTKNAFDPWKMSPFVEG